MSYLPILTFFFFIIILHLEPDSAAFYLFICLTSWPLLFMSSPVRYVVIQDGNVTDYPG